jgi:hypothetical protein
MTRVDYDLQAERYQSGRQAPLEDLLPWRDAIRPLLPAGPQPLVEIGSGTGIWLRAFATWFGRPVIGVEPSKGMRQVAHRQQLGPHTMVIGGTGEAIPLGPATCSMAWISTVIHHLRSISTCAVELRRVLTDGAPVLIRNSFPFRHEEIMLFRFFEGARRLANDFPPIEDIVAIFATAGFEMIDLQRIHQRAPENMQAFRDWATLMRHTDSALAPLSDAEFTEGLEAVDAAIADGETPIPLGLDLLVLA